MDKLVRNYCRESGVRSLEKHIEKIARKIAFNTVETQEGVVVNATTNTVTATVIPELIVSDEKITDVSERISEGISHESHNEQDIEVGQEETVNTFSFNIPTLEEVINMTMEEKKTPVDVKKVIVSPDNLEVYVGKARFSQDTIYDSAGTSLPPGVVMGLAWNPLVRMINTLHIAFLPSSSIFTNVVTIKFQYLKFFVIMLIYLCVDLYILVNLFICID